MKKTTRQNLEVAGFDEMHKDFQHLGSVGNEMVFDSEMDLLDVLAKTGGEQDLLAGL
ncbi:hypothetical protein F2Q70_00036809 [Brassica cretica]|uniref:Uncharacterized protein n=1 Tax=Brassica cretica TaxID=69181 RepID=A0A8S9K0H1_BRACR|nr:hypothetical protein F2Q68_00032130 [Brassica cretica]KAF2586906.1 hypothetical protein F2Q70_00036809 [Brassica cretica]KAF3599689.1 hypothetical protein F2Q69_00037613 [Brassica cretica]